MTPVYQRESNDCLRASIASILDRPIDDVPHFVAEHGDRCWCAALEWAQTQGLELRMSYGEDPGGLCIATGDGPRGRRHSVVWDGGLLHDPHPSGAGLIREPNYFATFAPEVAQ